MVDLHVHSTCSDGTYTPTQLVDYAIKKGLSAFALTDHDTVDGLEEALQYAQALTLNPPTPGIHIPRVIPGIELSTDLQGQEVHVVGLFIDYHDPEFRSYLQEFLESRYKRNLEMCERLRGCGFSITYESLEERFPEAVLTRAHYARYLLEHGYVKSIKEAFDRYLGDHCPCYVPREKVTPFQAVSLIRRAGGVPVLAHPILYHMSDARLDQLVKDLKAAGLVGIEAIYSTYAPSEERQIRRLAEKYELLPSGGSDFHGENKPGLDLGTGYGRLYVPEEILTALRKYHETTSSSRQGAF